VFSAEDPAPVAHATYPLGPRPSRHGRNARRSTLQLTQKGPLSNGPNTVGLLRGVAEGPTRISPVIVIRLREAAPLG
jgi:hypothetical protein